MTDTSICVAPVPTAAAVTITGRPFEFWEILDPADLTETGRRHHDRPRILALTESDAADLLGRHDEWPKWFRTRGERDRGPYRAALARQVFGPQPGYVARVGLERITWRSS